MTSLLSGRVRIEFLNIETGLPTRQPIVQENLIFNQTFLYMLGYQPARIFDSINPYFCTIVLLDDATDPTANDPSWTMLAAGSVPSGVTSPIWYESVLPNFGEIQNRVNAPSTPLTFNSVGLSWDFGTGADTNHLCRTKLTIPCTQQPFEILRIFYQIQVSNTLTNSLSKRFIKDFGGALFDSKRCQLYVLGASYADAPTQEYNDILQNENLIDAASISNITTTNFWEDSLKVDSHFKFKMWRLFKILQSGNVGHADEKIGQIFNCLLHGLSNNVQPSADFVPAIDGVENVRACYKIKKYSSTVLNINPLAPTFQPPFQRIWGHRANAPLPFFDESNVAIGSGSLSTSGAWTGKLPELYKIEITATGEIGTATYKFSRRKHFGFDDNTYTDKTELCIFRNPNIAAAPGHHGYRDENNHILKFSDTQIIQYDSTGVTLLDIYDGAYKNWDANTLNVLGVTALRQVSVNTQAKKIYCACRNTGLWIIDEITSAVTRPVTLPCYGVDVGFGGVVIAAFDGGLRTSADWNLVLPFPITAVDSAWNHIFYLKADPENANNQVAIVATIGARHQVVWYELSSNQVSTGLDSTVYPFGQWAAGLEVSDVGSVWACGNYQVHVFKFGDTTPVSVNTVFPSQNLNHSVWGSVRLYSVDFYKNFAITGAELLRENGTTEVSYTSIAFDESSYVLHLGEGVVLVKKGLRQLFTDNTYCWQGYGWNGTAWVKGNTNSKITHSNDQPLIDGLQIKFTNGVSAPSFYQGDFYTQGILHGVWKDNATTIFCDFYWYTRRINFNEAIPGGVVITPTYTLSVTTDPTFYRIETDSPKLTKLKINNVDVATVYFNGEAPAQNEITIDGASGVLTFNSADVGKPLSGFYAWIGT